MAQIPAGHRPQQLPASAADPGSRLPAPRRGWRDAACHLQGAGGELGEGESGDSGHSVDDGGLVPQPRCVGLGRSGRPRQQAHSAHWNDRGVGSHHLCNCDDSEHDSLRLGPRCCRDRVGSLGSLGARDDRGSLRARRPRPRIWLHHRRRLHRPHAGALSCGVGVPRGCRRGLESALLSLRRAHAMPEHAAVNDVQGGDFRLPVPVAHMAVSAARQAIPGVRDLDMRRSLVAR
mmetsp:Transcript_3088/g.6952  ORF Transcript_3088/g.6952 Transcript_3088/m.6952 type:complete len:233 (-) Transcript_3088:1052-1750(-)